MKKIIENKKGITLIALVITIIVLIILAGVSISVLLGENGIITRARQAAEEYAKASKNEQEALAYLDEYLNQTKFVKIAAGYNYSLALDDEGNIWSWGDNESGQLGDGTTTEKTLPQKLELNTTFKEISASKGYNGYSSLALDEEGKIWSWGYNGQGQLGDGTIEDKSIPQKLNLETTFKTIATGNYYSLALDEDGNIWSWGSNSSGELGNGTSESGYYENAPKKIELDFKFQTIAAGASHTLALDEEGNVWSWGHNSFGQLGDGTTTSKSVPQKLNLETTFKTITAGAYHSLAIDVYGNIWSWGNNRRGQLGDGRDGYGRYENAPKKLELDFKFKTIAAGNNHSLALDEKGNIWSWGDNYDGQLGYATKENRTSPQKLNMSSTFKEIVAGAYFTLTIDENQRIYYTKPGNIDKIIIDINNITEKVKKYNIYFDQYDENYSNFYLIDEDMNMYSCGSYSNIYFDGNVSELDYFKIEDGKLFYNDELAWEEIPKYEGYENLNLVIDMEKDIAYGQTANGDLIVFNNHREQFDLPNNWTDISDEKNIELQKDISVSELTYIYKNIKFVKQSEEIFDKYRSRWVYYLDDEGNIWLMYENNEPS